MVKLFRIPGTDVKIRIRQDEDKWLFIMFDTTGNDLMNPNVHAAEVRALFPTEPIDGGDLEEVTE